MGSIYMEQGSRFTTQDLAGTKTYQQTTQRLLGYYVFYGVAYCSVSVFDLVSVAVLPSMLIPVFVDVDVTVSGNCPVSVSVRLS